MKFGIELVSIGELNIPPASHFEIRAIVNGVVTENTAGRDEYRTAVTLAAGQRLAATGRLNIWDSTITPPCALRVRPTYLVPLTVRPRGRLGILLRTSIPLGQGDVQSGMIARVVSGTARLRREIPLGQPGVTVNWEGRGRFRIDLGLWPLSGRTKGGDIR